MPALSIRVINTLADDEDQTEVFVSGPYDSVPQRDAEIVRLSEIGDLSDYRFYRSDIPIDIECNDITSIDATAVSEVTDDEDGVETLERLMWPAS